MRRTQILAIAGAASAIASACPEHAMIPTPMHGAAQLPQISEELDWRTLEAPLLSGHVQLTHPDRFLKAGEAYFSPCGTKIVFQAIPVPGANEAEEEHYQMYVAEIQRARSGRISGLGRVVRLSPPGSYNTCGWFHPTRDEIVFASTIGPPAAQESAGYQRDGSRYQWFFPEETEIVVTPDPLASSSKVALLRSTGPDGALLSTAPLRPMFERAGYDAEGSFTPDGRWYLYANVDPDADEKQSADLWIYDTETEKQIPIVIAPGYDGGPFFSPQDDRICYRSDRNLNNQLQIFVADLQRDEGGAITGATERQLTDNSHVNWAPFFHPSGRFLVYTTSEQGHFNYEVYAIETEPAPGAEARKLRVTHAAGFDGLPVFDLDGTMMMWTTQRGEGGSSQIWLAEVAPAESIDDWLSRSEAEAR